MPNYDFTSPVYLMFLVVYFITSSIKIYDISIYHAIRDGRIVRPFGSWIASLHWLDWAIALILLILNWKYALIIFLVRYILKIIGLLHNIGFLILLPFITKIPRGITNVHLEIAKTMFILLDEPLLKSPLVFFPSSTTDLNPKFNHAQQAFEKLEFSDNDLEAIMKALDYLRADDNLKSESRIFYFEEKERKEREQKWLKEKEEWEEQEQY